MCHGLQYSILYTVQYCTVLYYCRFKVSTVSVDRMVQYRILYISPYFLSLVDCRIFRGKSLSSVLAGVKQTARADLFRRRITALAANMDGQSGNKSNGEAQILRGDVVAR